MIEIEIIDGNAVSSIEINGLNEDELRKILLEMKNVNQIIGDLIVDMVKNKVYLTFEQTKVITDEVKNGNIKKAIKSHQFFIDSSTEEAEVFVKKVEDNINLYESDDSI